MRNRRFRRGSPLLLSDGSPLLLSDGFPVLLSDSGEPTDFQPVRISHTDRTFRDVAVALDPWLYWPLDEGAGLTAVDDISGHDRDGTWTTAAGGAVLYRDREVEQAAVPYGAAPKFQAGAAPGITGPRLTGLGVAATVSLFVRIDPTATGSATVLDARASNRGIAITRQRVNAGIQTISVAVDADAVTADIVSGAWVWLLFTRDASSLVLRVDGIAAASTPVTNPTRRIDAVSASETFDLAAAGTLDAWLDEVAAWDAVLPDSSVTALGESRGGWRAFGGEIYPISVTRLPTASMYDMPGVGGSMRLDRSDLIAAFATPNQASAGTVARMAMALLGWQGTTYGCDLDTLISRIVARGGSGSDFMDRLMRAAEGIWWPDAWEDLHTDRAGATRHIDVAITEDDIEPGWKPRSLLQHFRTRTVARGGGISGGFSTFDFVGDGSTSAWQPPEQIRSVAILYIDGAPVAVGPSETWQVTTSGFVLETTGTPPGVGIVGKLEYEIEAPLVAVAEDAAQITGTPGLIVRSVEDSTIDTAEGIQELARTEQQRHGQKGLELDFVLHPRYTPLFYGVGGSPIVRVRGVDQRMLLHRLETSWVNAGEQVRQRVILRAHDLTSDLEYWRSQQQPRYQAPAPSPVRPDPHIISNLGQRLPQPLGGDWQVSEGSNAWQDVPGVVEVIVNWAFFQDVDLICTFMAQLVSSDGQPEGARVARVRLRDITRGVTLSQEHVVSGVGERLYTIPDIVGPAGGGISRLRLQHRRVSAGIEVATWGGELDVAV